MNVKIIKTLRSGDGAAVPSNLPHNIWHRRVPGSRRLRLALHFRHRYNNRYDDSYKATSNTDIAYHKHFPNLVKESEYVP